MTTWLLGSPGSPRTQGHHQACGSASPRAAARDTASSWGESQPPTASLVSGRLPSPHHPPSQCPHCSFILTTAHPHSPSRPPATTPPTPHPIPLTHHPHLHVLCHKLAQHKAGREQPKKGAVPQAGQAAASPSQGTNLGGWPQDVKPSRCLRLPLNLKFIRPSWAQYAVQVGSAPDPQGYDLDPCSQCQNSGQSKCPRDRGGEEALFVQAQLMGQARVTPSMTSPSTTPPSLIHPHAFVTTAS